MDCQAIQRLFDAGHVCVRVITREEPEALGELAVMATGAGLDPWTWSVTRGLQSGALTGGNDVPNTENPAAALVWFMRNVTAPAALFMLDLGDHLTDARAARALREIIERFRAEQLASTAALASGKLPGASKCSRLIMIDANESVPATIGFLSARFEPTPPDDSELEKIIRTTVHRLHRQKAVTVDIDKDELRACIETLRGLSRRQAADVIAEVVANDRVFSSDDLPRMIAAKQRLLQDTGVLEFVNAPATMQDIGGLTRLKAWLEERRESFGVGARQYGLSPPRGVLLLGVQGSGKSLASKAIATAWRRPLMRLDPSTLFDKFIGESERRLREALRQAESMSPVVLWIDEIEKGFASAASTSVDGGLSRRMFGTLLTWMQEHAAPVFTVATANDIEALPPELLRKGRFDEIFFVDLPGPAVRKDIFAIHLRRRGIDPKGLDLEALAVASNGFSGAEIEQAVLAALHGAMARKEPPGSLSTQRLVDAVRTSPPLSVTMAEKIDELRRWAKGRCVPAD